MFKLVYQLAVAQTSVTVYRVKCDDRHRKAFDSHRMPVKIINRFLGRYQNGSSSGSKNLNAMGQDTFQRCFSNKVKVTNGVPLDSTLEPILLLIYASNLPGIESYLNMFAGTANIIRKIKFIQDRANYVKT